jgi:hypothetical protein
MKLYILDFIHGLYLDHELDEQLQYVPGLPFERPTTWCKLFLHFMMD